MQVDPLISVYFSKRTTTSGTHSLCIRLHVMQTYQDTYTCFSFILLRDLPHTRHSKSNNLGDRDIAAPIPAISSLDATAQSRRSGASHLQSYRPLPSITS
jgi:hypothetical protein